MNTNTPSQRFRDRCEHIHQFMEEILVVCPKCRRRAVVQRKDPERMDLFAPRQLTCQNCGMTKHWQKQGIFGSGPDAAEDDYFHLPLWLQSRCCGHVLWAYNARHLQFLRDYVGSNLRERCRSPELGWSNSSLASRLPRWKQVAKNRDSILRTIKKLEARLRDIEASGVGNKSRPLRQRTNRPSGGAGSGP